MKCLTKKKKFTKAEIEIHEFLLTKLSKNIIQSRYSLSIVLLCFRGALNLCCMVQLKKKKATLEQLKVFDDQNNLS
jgi:hypothetical protein